MILLLVIADDFTGALDTGVQFASFGVKTQVTVDCNVQFDNYDTTVLVVDTETRHLSSIEAYKSVFQLVKRAKEAGIQYIYKKTDSALRGNIGAELEAVINASGCNKLPFIPAFPQIDRITKDGVHYIDGIPVTESPFGKDPFEPVKHDKIVELIGEQSRIKCESISLDTYTSLSMKEGILIFDCVSTQELDDIGTILIGNKETIFAGCAGFGEILPKLLNIPTTEIVTIPKLKPHFLVVCGSVNPITLQQIDQAEKYGFYRIRLTPKQKLLIDYWSSEEGKQDITIIEKILMEYPLCVIETNDEGGNQLTANYANELGIDLETVRVRISSNLGQLVNQLFTNCSLGTLLLTGGDTLLQCMNSIGVHELEPICELEKGIVLAKFTYKECTRYIITKSGGFGQENLLINLANNILQ